MFSLAPARTKEAGRAGHPTMTAPSSLNSQVFPRFSLENFEMKSNNRDCSFERIGGCILITTIAGIFDAENSVVFRKSLSLDKIALPFSQANEYNFEFVSPFSVYAILIPFSFRNFTSLASTSSSQTKLMFDIYKLLTG